MFIRLMGVRVDNLTSKDEMQMSFFAKDSEKQEKLDKTIDLLKDKYGYDLVTRAGKMNMRDIVRKAEEKHNF